MREILKKRSKMMIGSTETGFERHQQRKGLSLTTIRALKLNFILSSGSGRSKTLVEALFTTRERGAARRENFTWRKEPPRGVRKETKLLMKKAPY